MKLIKSVKKRQSRLDALIETKKFLDYHTQLGGDDCIVDSRIDFLVKNGIRMVYKGLQEHNFTSPN